MPDGFAMIITEIFAAERPRVVPRFDDIVFDAGQLKWQLIS
jgi:hypothetical protein